MDRGDESPWQRAYDASIAEEAERAAQAAEELDPAWRWSIEIRARFALAVALIGFVGLGVGLLLSGPWYVSVIGVMVLTGALLAAVGSLRGDVWTTR